MMKAAFNCFSLLLVASCSPTPAFAKPDWCAILRNIAAPVDLLHDTSFHDIESQP